MKIAIIGAGLGGLTFGAYAAKEGHQVHIFDKNHAPGGVAALLEHEGYKFEQGPLLMGDMLPGEGLYELLRELGIELETQRADRDIVMPDYDMIKSLEYGGKYYLFYNAKNLTYGGWKEQIGICVGDDPLHFTRLPEQPAVPVGEAGAWDSIFASDPSVVYSIKDNLWVMYYYGYNGVHAGEGIAFSRDLIHWEYSPINPVMMYNEAEDKQIANPFLTVEEQRQIADALDINNSDMELCEFLGRTIIYYSWGDQKGTEFLAEACYEGSMKEFLQGWFEVKE